MDGEGPGFPVPQDDEGLLAAEHRRPRLIHARADPGRLSRGEVHDRHRVRPRRGVPPHPGRDGRQASRGVRGEVLGRYGDRDHGRDGRAAERVEHQRLAPAVVDAGRPAAGRSQETGVPGEMTDRQAVDLGSVRHGQHLHPRLVAGDEQERIEGHRGLRGEK
ncbi:hypothetical protein SUDANB15_00734 [Streptomyces sp. enrichment culture]